MLIAQGGLPQDAGQRAGPRRIISPALPPVLITLALSLSTPVIADTVQIPGPVGPLAGEALAVDGAAHAVVIVPGSGPIDRDGNAPAMGLSSDTYRLLAEGLAGAGIASIRIDKRGFFGSESAIADPEDVTIAAYAADVRAWVGRAAELAPCVWLAGHSEGGLVALVAATDPPDDMCGLILLATPGRPIGRLLVEQSRANPFLAPLMPEIEAIVADLEAGRMRDMAEIPHALAAIFRPGLQRFMIDLFAYDPVAIARGRPSPALIVQGNADMQVKPLDADRLQAALPGAGRLLLQGGTHMLKQDLPGDPLASYRNPALPLHPDLIPAIAGFLAGHQKHP